jgi:magnesium-transporting ATPase (P-type)
MNIHAKPLETIVQEFNANTIAGLNDVSIQKARETYGFNELPPPKETPMWLQFLQEFNDPIMYILIAAGIVNALVAEPKDALVIAFVVILNTVVGFIQERRAESALQSLKKLTAPTARVLRNGQMLEIPARELVCGDVLLVESGTRLAADARIFEAQTLQVDESMLTGESLAVTKNPVVQIDDRASVGDRLNMLFAGTIVQRGRGKAIVTGIGLGTEFSKISTEIQNVEENASPLQERLEGFGKYLSIGIVIIVVLIFVIGWLRGESALAMALTAIGLAVSAIPEGLPMSVTITLSIGMRLMAKRNAVVRKLVAVETLGSTNVICSDKTGTLTRNQMTAMSLFTDGVKYSISGTGYDKKGVITDTNGNSLNAAPNLALEWLIRTGQLCTETRLKDAGAEATAFEVVGDPTEAALLVLAHKAGKTAEREQWSVSVDLPFESERQFMAVTAEKADKRYVLLKGSLERLLPRSSVMLRADGSTMPIDAGLLQEQTERFAEQGLRVLFLAMKEVHGKVSSEELENLADLVYVGLVGIVDPAREDARAAIEECRNAGIRVKMITGDHAKTAQAIAYDLRLTGEDKPEVLAGRELEAMSDDELYKRVETTDVYARVSPTDKLRIVKQLQKYNLVVAMTGDGVNDAPALKQADIGIAMGSGTDVAKDVSGMVITDDNFVSIAAAVRRGRVIFSNLRHILIYILTTSLGGVLTVASSVLAGFPLPILPAQLLWINLVTDGTSTFPLAFEKEHGNVMKYKPRKRDEALLSSRMIGHIIFCGAWMMLGTLSLFWYSLNVMQEPLLKAQTVAFCTLALFQIWNVQNSRSLERSLFWNLPGRKSGESVEKISFSDNLPLLGVMVFAMAMQIGAVELPFIDGLLNTPFSLDASDWMRVLGVSFSIIVVVEIEKLVLALKNKFWSK